MMLFILLYLSSSLFPVANRTIPMSENQTMVFNLEGERNFIIFQDLKNIEVDSFTNINGKYIYVGHSNETNRNSAVFFGENKGIFKVHAFLDTNLSYSQFILPEMCYKVYVSTGSNSSFVINNEGNSKFIGTRQICYIRSLKEKSETKIEYKSVVNNTLELYNNNTKILIENTTIFESKDFMVHYTVSNQESPIFLNISSATKIDKKQAGFESRFNFKSDPFLISNESKIVISDFSEKEENEKIRNLQLFISDNTTYASDLITHRERITIPETFSINFEKYNIEEIMFNQTNGIAVFNDLLGISVAIFYVENNEYHYICKLNQETDIGFYFGNKTGIIQITQSAARRDDVIVHTTYDYGFNNPFVIRMDSYPTVNAPTDVIEQNKVLKTSIDEISAEFNKLIDDDKDILKENSAILAREDFCKVSLNISNSGVNIVFIDQNSLSLMFFTEPNCSINFYTGSKAEFSYIGSMKKDGMDRVTVARFGDQKGIVLVRGEPETSVDFYICRVHDQSNITCVFNMQRILPTATNSNSDILLLNESLTCKKKDEFYSNLTDSEYFETMAKSIDVNPVFDEGEIFIQETVVNFSKGNTQIFEFEIPSANIIFPDLKGVVVEGYAMMPDKYAQIGSLNETNKNFGFRFSNHKSAIKVTKTENSDINLTKFVVFDDVAAKCKCTVVSNVANTSLLSSEMELTNSDLESNVCLIHTMNSASNKMLSKFGAEFRGSFGSYMSIVQKNGFEAKIKAHNAPFYGEYQDDILLRFRMPNNPVFRFNTTSPREYSPSNKFMFTIVNDKSVGVIKESGVEEVTPTEENFISGEKLKNEVSHDNNNTPKIPTRTPRPTPLAKPADDRISACVIRSNPEVLEFNFLNDSTKQFISEDTNVVAFFESTENFDVTAFTSGEKNNYKFISSIRGDCFGISFGENKGVINVHSSIPSTLKAYIITDLSLEDQLLFTRVTENTEWEPESVPMPIDEVLDVEVSIKASLEELKDLNIFQLIKVHFEKGQKPYRDIFINTKYYSIYFPKIDDFNATILIFDDEKRLDPVCFLTKKSKMRGFHFGKECGAIRITREEIDTISDISFYLIQTDKAPSMFSIENELLITSVPSITAEEEKIAVDSLVKELEKKNIITQDNMYENGKEEELETETEEENEFEFKNDDKERETKNPDETGSKEKSDKKEKEKEKDPSVNIPDEGDKENEEKEKEGEKEENEKKKETPKEVEEKKGDKTKETEIVSKTNAKRKFDPNVITGENDDKPMSVVSIFVSLLSMAMVLVSCCIVCYIVKNNAIAENTPTINSDMYTPEGLFESRSSKTEDEKFEDVTSTDVLNIEKIKSEVESPKDVEQNIEIVKPEEGEKGKFNPFSDAVSYDFVSPPKSDVEESDDDFKPFDKFPEFADPSSIKEEEFEQFENFGKQEDFQFPSFKNRTNSFNEDILFPNV